MLDVLIVFFFFKQKTAYEIMPSLVGSEMCIRDRDACCCTISAEPGQCVAGPHHRAVVDELEAGWWAGEEQLVEIRRPRRVGEPQPLPCCDSEGLLSQQGSGCG